MGNGGMGHWELVLGNWEWGMGNWFWGIGNKKNELFFFPVAFFF
jgi:hypothetical protein